MILMLRENPNFQVALVKGDPGMGKTTLMKKIVYEWACGYLKTSEDSATVDRLQLILTVPLRSAKKTSDFLQMAVEYFTELFRMDDAKSVLIREINQLGSKVLICLDGLDEYRSYADSPFKSLFAAPFNLSASNSRTPPPQFTYNLIITSRPYALLSVNPDFFPLQFEICTFDETRLSEFVNSYCNTQEAIDRATKYLQSATMLVAKVPLILTFICYLAEVDEVISTNPTLLYENFIRQMILREKHEDKLNKSISPKKWKESTVVKTTARLAFYGCIAEDYEFDDAQLQEYNVSEDSFICGFLLHKYDSAEEDMKAEFAHRSIQDFFAAMHCVKLMETQDTSQRSLIIKAICKGDSQFGRFFFAICSTTGKFVTMLKWLNISLADVFGNPTEWNLGAFISTLSDCLVDCSFEDQFAVGKILRISTEDICRAMATIKCSSTWEMTFFPSLDHETVRFFDGLNMKLLGPKGCSYDEYEPDLCSWYIVDPEQPKVVPVAAINCFEFFIYDCTEIHLLMVDLVALNSSIQRLLDNKDSYKNFPPIRCLVLKEKLSKKVARAVNFYIQYTSAGDSTRLETLSLFCTDAHPPQLKTRQTKCDMTALHITHKESSSGNAKPKQREEDLPRRLRDSYFPPIETFWWIHVTVDTSKEKSQAHIISALIDFAYCL